MLPAQRTDVATFEEERPGPFRRAQHFLHAYPTTIPFLVLVLGVLFFSFIVGGKFFAPFNLSLILQQVTIIAMLGIAQTLVILTAGIDLSVGVIMILCLGGDGPDLRGLWRAARDRLSARLRSSAGLCGAVNGLIVTILRLPPFIVTLGTWSIFGALNIFYSRSETIRQQDIEAVAPFLQWTGTIIKPYDVLQNARA